MTSLVRQKAKEEKKKRYTFLGTTAAGIALGMAGVTFFAVPVVGAGIYFGYDWFKFRGKNGMKF